YRPLLLSSASPELAFARGIPVRITGALCLVAVALAVSLSALTIGAILSTALLVGPAAAALRLTSRPGLAVLWSAVIGLAATWLGVLLAYDSYYWPPAHQGWPVSFFVVALVLVFYLLAQFAVTRPAGDRPGPGRWPPGTTGQVPERCCPVSWSTRGSSPASWRWWPGRWVSSWCCAA